MLAGVHAFGSGTSMNAPADAAMSSSAMQPRMNDEPSMPH